jgi:hypothetical protein
VSALDLVQPLGRQVPPGQMAAQVAARPAALVGVPQAGQGAPANK